MKKMMKIQRFYHKERIKMDKDKENVSITFNEFNKIDGEILKRYRDISDQIDIVTNRIKSRKRSSEK